MRGDILGAIFYIIFLVAIMVFAVRVRQMKAVHILDYQAGVRFNGSRYSILSPGIYFSNASSNPITVVDMRPHQFIVERQFYKDALSSSFAISLNGELQVTDPHLAVTTLKNLVDDSLAIVQEGLPLAASRSIVDPGPDGREDLASAFTTELNRELQTKGVKVRGVRISELRLQPSSRTVPTVTN